MYGLCLHIQVDQQFVIFPNLIPPLRVILQILQLMKFRVLFLILFVGILFSGCEEKSSIEGLWVINKVKVGDQIMTPNARWTRFHADFTQESGNGWLQHSYGTWNLNPETNELSITNTNGIDDPEEPFKVVLKNDTMTWVRNEGGQNVEVTLERATHLPETYGDKLFGLWGLKEAIGDGTYFGKNSNVGGYIHFRWDKRFVIQSEKGRINGVYNVNGHKPEVEFIPYGDINRNFWNIEFNDSIITLKLLNTDSTVIRKFKRIHTFPVD